MLSVSTKVDKGGFWYLVDATDDCQFTLSYIVIGTGGRQGSGEIEGLSSKLKDWQYVEIGFPVLHVGVTDLRVSRPPLGDARVPRLRLSAEQLSRRRSIKQITAMILAGWAMTMFPTVTSHARPLTDKITPDSEPHVGGAGSFNPYSSDAFDPYFNPY